MKEMNDKMDTGGMLTYATGFYTGLLQKVMKLKDITRTLRR